VTRTTPRIDAHHHFWDPARYSYPWMAGDAMDPVRRAFTPDDLRGPLAAERIDGTVLVQTLSSVPETREFLQLAAASGPRRSSGVKARRTGSMASPAIQGYE
jgi:predicted TIM-barrel fold metal-dependent hydrolase